MVMKADRCRAAVAVLDRALEDGADKVYDDVAEAARCLVQLRDELTARAREATAADLLQQCNAILSMVVGSEYHWLESAATVSGQAREPPH
jgi:hypothetical protein